MRQMRCFLAIDTPSYYDQNSTELDFSLLPSFRVVNTGRHHHPHKPPVSVNLSLLANLHRLFPMRSPITSGGKYIQRKHVFKFSARDPSELQVVGSHYVVESWLRD